jgi:hypothetical protein
METLTQRLNATMSYWTPVVSQPEEDEGLGLEESIENPILPIERSYVPDDVVDDNDMIEWPQPTGIPEGYDDPVISEIGMPKI